MAIVYNGKLTVASKCITSQLYVIKNKILDNNHAQCCIILVCWIWLVCKHCVCVF